jgi:hypothetical protein
MRPVVFLATTQVGNKWSGGKDMRLVTIAVVVEWAPGQLPQEAPLGF